MKHKDAFYERYGLPKGAVVGLMEIATLSGVPLDCVKLIYDRGMVVAPTEAPQFSFHKKRKQTKPKGKGMERVYEFVMKGKTFSEADKDCAEYFNLAPKENGV